MWLRGDMKLGVGDREQYERWYNEEVQKVRKLKASNASLQGAIT